MGVFCHCWFYYSLLYNVVLVHRSQYTLAPQYKIGSYLLHCSLTIVNKYCPSFISSPSHNILQWYKPVGEKADEGQCISYNWMFRVGSPYFDAVTRANWSTVGGNVQRALSWVGSVENERWYINLWPLHTWLYQLVAITCIPDFINRDRLVERFTSQASCSLNSDHISVLPRSHTIDYISLSFRHPQMLPCFNYIKLIGLAPLN